MKFFADHVLTTKVLFALAVLLVSPQMLFGVDMGLKEKTVSVLLVDPTNPSILYVGTRNGGGMFKSSDGGKNWTELEPMRRVNNILALEIDPKNTETLYAATSSGVLRSDDGGQNWKTVNFGLPTPTINALEIDPDNPSTLYAGTWGDGVFKSTNRGDSWSSANEGLAAAFLYALEMDPKNSRTLYAGTGRGLFKSTDAGEKWSRLTADEEENTIQAIVFNPQDSSHLMVVSNPWVPGSGYAGRILKSTNQGSDWAAIGTGLPQERIYALEVDQQDPNRLYCGTESGVFSSSDGGANWKALKMESEATAVRSIAFGAGRVYAGTSSGILVW